jgi:hypothetical protein
MSMPGSNRKTFLDLDAFFIVRVGIGLLILFLVSITISRILYPFDTGHYEAFNLIPARHLLEGKNPYAFALIPPHSMAPYGIVFYGYLAVGLTLFGFQLWFGKILTVISYGLCFWLIVKVTSRATESKEASLVAGLVWLAMFPGQFWIAVIRPDLIGLAFAFSAVAMIFNVEKEQKIGPWYIVLTGLLASTAFFTKQTFFLPLIFIALRLLQIRKWLEFSYFIITCSGLIITGMIALNYTSDNGYFWQHFTHAKTLPYSLSQSFRTALDILSLPTFLFFKILAIIFVSLNLHFFRDLSRQKLLNIIQSPKSLIFCYCLVSLVWSFLSTGRTGANVNYYLEATFLMAVVTGLIYVDLKQKGFYRLLLVMIILLTLGGIFQLGRIGRGEYFRWQAINYYREIEETASRIIRPGDSCISVYAELVLRNGCSLNFDDIGEYTGGWSQILDKTFQEQVRAGNYAVIILQTDNFQQAFPNYRLVPMSEKPPEKFYKAFLYIRNSEK